MGTSEGKYRIILQSGGSTEKTLSALREVLGVTNAEAFHLMKNSPTVIFSTDDRELAEKKAARLKELGAPVQFSKSAVSQSQRRIGWNEPCPCGSGKKYKLCHGSGEYRAHLAEKSPAPAAKPAAAQPAPKPAAAQPAPAAPRQTGFVPPKKKPVRPVVYGKAPSLFTAERAGAWLLLAGISAAMPIALYLFYVVYAFLMSSLARALPGVYKVVSFLFDNLGEATMCGLLATGVYLLFADTLFLKAESLCPARLGLRYLVLGLLMLGATLAAFFYFMNHPSKTDGQSLHRILLTLYAMLLDGIFLLKSFHHCGNPRLLFWKKKVTVFAYQPADKATFYAKITGGPGLVTLGGDFDRVNLSEMIRRMHSAVPNAAVIPGQFVFCCTVEKKGYMCCDYIEVEKADLQTGYFQAAMINARNYKGEYRGIRLPYDAEKAPEIPYTWQ